jgi:hypothetical protein
MTRPATNGTRRNAAVRSATYTRKSLEEGLEQEFNCGFRGKVARESAMMSPSIPILCRSAFRDDFARHSGMISLG